MKKRLLQGFGIALVFASPMWITLSEPRHYLNFGLSLITGALLLSLASQINERWVSGSALILSLHYTNLGELTQL